MISNNKGHLELFYPNFSSLGIYELEYITLTLYDMCYYHYYHCVLSNCYRQ